MVFGVAGLTAFTSLHVYSVNGSKSYKVTNFVSCVSLRQAFRTDEPYASMQEML